MRSTHAEPPVEERPPAAPDFASPAARAAALRQAYARGRRDERARHRRSPLLAAVFGLAAMVGAALLGSMVDDAFDALAEAERPVLATASPGPAPMVMVRRAGAAGGG